MKAFTNQNARTLDEAVTLAQEAIRDGLSVSFVGGGTDLLQLMKDKVVNRPGSGEPDVLVNLKTVDGLDGVTSRGQNGVTVGGLTTIGALAEHPIIRNQFTVLAEAAESVATPQIRNAGTLGGKRRPAAMVLVLSQRLPVLQGWGQPVLLDRGGKTSSTRSSAADRALSSIPRTSRLRSSPWTRRSGSWGPMVSGPCPDRTSSCFRVRTLNTRTFWRTTRCWHRSSFQRPVTECGVRITRSWIVRHGPTRW